MTERVLQLNTEKAIFWSILGSLLLCFAFYIYFINATVHNVVARQNLEAQASSLTLALGNQEFQYITSKNNVTLALAHSLGFKEISAKTFITKDKSEQVSFLSR